MNEQLFSRIDKILSGEGSNHLKLMHEKIVNNKFKIIVECGVDRGASTYAFLAASNKVDCKVYSLDIRDCSNIIEHKNWNFLKINDLDLENILQKFPEIKEHGIDLLYIDSYHEPSHVKNILEKYFSLININGFIFVDDTSAFPFRKRKILTDSINSDLCRDSVEEFYFSNSEAINYNYDGNENGLCILNKKKNIDVNKDKIWKYNILIYHIIKLLKKLKYKFFYKIN